MATATSRLPPSPKGGPLSNLREFHRNQLKFLIRAADECGDAAYFRFGPQHGFLFNHPDYIGEILVKQYRNFVRGRGYQTAKKVILGEGLITTDGDFHHQQRRLVQPAFSKKRFSTYGAIMSDYADRAQSSWQDGMTVDMSQEMMRLTLSILTKTLFDADVETEAKEMGKDVYTVLEGSFKLITNPLIFALERFSLPVPTSRRLRKARERLDKVIYRIIDERRASGEDHGDLISMLLVAQDEQEIGSRMTDLQVRDQAMTILAAGHETIALALTWTLYLLSQNPEQEAKLHAELDAELGGRLPTVDDMPRLEYTRRVFTEAMRLYPPVWAAGRISIKDVQIGDYRVPAGSHVMISQYIMHRDPRYYPDPHRFDPDRWLPEAEASRPRFTYFPFLEGAHRCIGENFSWMEGVLVVATLTQRWRMQLSPGFSVELKPLITLRPRHGMQMTLKSRYPYSSNHTRLPEARAASASI